MRRRQYLAALATGLSVGVAGCNSDSADETQTQTTAGSTTTTRPLPQVELEPAGIDENNASGVPDRQAYYFKQTGLTAEKLRRDETTRAETKRDIKRWFISSLLHGTFSGSADSVLTRIREILNNQSGKGFPVEAIEAELADLGKMTGFNEEMVENILEYTKGGSRTFLTLTLLYDQIDFGSIQYHQDHIFPSNRLSEDSLVEQGIDRDRARTFEAKSDRLANLQLLTGRENEAKQDEPFEEWIKSRDQSFYDTHLIPTDPQTHQLENFDLFVAQRAELIRRELQSVLGPVDETPK